MNPQDDQKVTPSVVVTGSVGGEDRKIKLAILIASIGLILFIVITLTFSFREPIFSALFPKPASEAASSNTATSSANLGGTIKGPVDKPNDKPNLAPASSFEGAKKIFVSSTIYDGNLGGLDGADEKCQQQASTSSLGGTWKAWLSDSSTSAKTRITPHNGPYKLVDGSVVADNFEDLVDKVIKKPIDLNEYGATVSWSVWTDTGADGEIASTESCKNWTSNLGNDSGRVGSTSYGDQRWTFYSSSTCNYTRRLYCIEQ